MRGPTSPGSGASIRIQLPGKGKSRLRAARQPRRPRRPARPARLRLEPRGLRTECDRVTASLRALDLLVVADIVLSETAALADVVLPVTQWAEETGTMTNLEGRVILRQQAVTPPTGVRSDLEIVAGLAERLSAPSVWPVEPESVFDELRRASAGGRADYSGISYARIRDEDGVFWPCATDGAPTPRMFTETFAHPDGLARCVDGTYEGPAEAVDPSYPVHLTTGRVLSQYQSGAQTRRIRALPDGGVFVELHPLLAQRVGALDGAPVTVTTRRGTLTAPARVVTTIRPDTVFIPFHWVGANRLTHDALDPSSRMPEFKVCAAAVSA